MDQTLEEIRGELLALRRDVRSEQGKTINKRSLLARTKAVAGRWFSDVAPTLTGRSGIPAEIVERYSSDFRRLIKISAPSNRKSSYEETLGNLLRHFRDELVLPIQTRPAEVAEVTALDQLLGGLPDPEEDAYLKEAIACAKCKLYRGAVVLGWSAAIDRIHRTIARMGFATFNSVSQQMAKQDKGRFKKFNAPQHVNSLSELREVFDNVVLWIIEGMELVDVNQHARLHSCFELRCQCAHPGDAPITEYNLLSFFSDLTGIVFRNAQFQVPSAAQSEPALPAIVSTPKPPEN